MKAERIGANVAVVLVGAGRVPEPAFAAAAGFAAARGGAFVAADGGARHLAERGIRPRAILGDLDSLGDPAPWAAAGVPVIGIADQDTTDFEKCLDRVDAPLYLAVGFAGDRIDHLLAALSAMAARPDRAVILLGDEDLVLLAPHALDLDLAPGTRVSLWPMAETRVTACTGLRWPALGLTLDPAGRIGTSNAALGGPVTLGFDRRGVFLVLPLAELGRAAALLDPQHSGRLTASPPSEVSL